MGTQVKMTKQEKHIKRKGIGCSNEFYEEDCKKAFCSHAEYTFGGHYYCKAPKGCWLDEKIKNKFDGDKHCPNCSEPNKPFKLNIIQKGYGKCPKCGFRYTTTFA